MKTNHMLRDELAHSHNRPNVSAHEAVATMIQFQTDHCENIRWLAEGVYWITTEDTSNKISGINSSYPIG